MTKTIPLTRGRVTVVDEEDYPSLSAHKWYCTAQGYAARRKTIAPGKSKIVFMHNEILNFTPVRGQLVVDHKDKDTLNNQRYNLVPGTHQQNMLNRQKAKGVSFDGRHNRYKAYCDTIVLGEAKKRVNLGTFKTEKEALAAVAAYHAKRGDD